MQIRRGDKQSSAVNPAPQSHAPSLTSYWMTGFAGAALVVLLAFAAALFLWADRDRANLLAQARSCSDMLAQDIGARVAVLRDQLRELAVDPQLQSAMRGGDPQVLKAQEDSLRRLVPDALKVRLLLPGRGGFPDGEGQTLSYAGSDLVYRAENNRRVTPVEVHRVGREDMHLAVAGPVLDKPDGPVLGVAYAALPVSYLPTAGTVGDSGNRILVHQRSGAEIAAVDPQAGSGLPDGEPAYSVDVPGTRLEVAAWITQGRAFNGGLLLIGAGGYLIVIALLGLMLWIPLRGMRNALAADYAGIVAVVEDAASNQPIRRVKCHLAETLPVADVLRRLLRDISKQRQSARKLTPTPASSSSHVSPLSGAPQGDDSSGVVESMEADIVEVEAASPPGMEVRHLPADVEPLDLGDIDLDALLPVMGGKRQGAPEASGEVTASIFRAYDVRGIVGEGGVSAELSRDLGLAVGSLVAESGETLVTVARDTRSSGAELTESLVSGLRATGRDVVDLGVAPTPLLYFATRYRGNSSGIMVTASHNPPEYNGFKVVIGGTSLQGPQITGLRERILRGEFVSGNGSYDTYDLRETYISHVEKDVAVARPLKLVIDCGNAAASVVAGELYRTLGCEVVEMNCDAQAGFPEGRVPDPTREICLEPLCRQVVAEQADLGLSFDGDGDRLGVVDSSGKIIWTDRVLMLLAADVLSRHPGTDVIYDVKSSHHLAGEILRNGGRPVMWRSGHSPLKAKLAETGALLAGEWSGHIIFRERWYGFDDALYAGARLLEVLALDPRPTAEVFSDLPEAIATPELFVEMPEGAPKGIMAAINEVADRLEDVRINRMDGLRVEFDRGWGLVRASNTRPALVFRFEADDQSAMEKLQALFRKLMERAAPHLDLPF